MKRLIGKYTEEYYCIRCRKSFKTEIKLRQKSEGMMVAEMHLELVMDKKCPFCGNKFYHV